MWRQPLQQLHAAPNATAGFLRAGEDADTVVTAVGGQVAAWAASDGRVAWTHALEDAPVHDLEILELDEGKARAEDGKDAILLVGGTNPSVKRLDALSGRVKWEFEDTRYARHDPSPRVWLTDMGVGTRRCRYQHPPRLSITYPHIRRLQGV